jgi:hypothetical protein
MIEKKQNNRNVLAASWGIAAFLIFSFILLSKSFAGDSTFSSVPTVQNGSNTCNYNFVDSYDGTVQPIVDTPTLTTTPGQVLPLTFYNNANPSPTTTPIPAICKGRTFKIYFIIDLQANSNLSQISISPSITNQNGTSLYTLPAQTVLSSVNSALNSTVTNASNYNNQTAYCTPNTNVPVVGGSGSGASARFNMTCEWMGCGSFNLVLANGGNGYKVGDTISMTPTSSCRGFSTYSTTVTSSMLSAYSTTSTSPMPLTIAPQCNNSSSTTPYCSIGQVSGSSFVTLNPGDTVTAPTINANASVTVIGGQFRVYACPANATSC